VLLFDVDEHTGNFGGAKAFFENEELRSGVEGVMIGYPGNDRVVIGGRGVFRFRIHVRGVSSHSGGSTATPNAISKAASLITKLSTVEFPAETGVFPRPPKLTVTLVEGGEGYSTTPDLCTINVDVRLTPDFPCKRALTLMQDLLGQLDTDWLETPKTQIEPVMYWPAYQLPDDCLVSSSLLAAARDCGLSPKAHVAGPSNIGNYLAGFDIPATAGFGVTYKGLHATDEQIELASIEPVYGTYLQALHCLLRR
jgi:succinyl-diaminopimelate desuccinylase